ncbi:hypothetical protein H4R21_003312 [Coemansia helicoidea]|uniref:Uncharacterized protein n=1 Tax=Coemansia helicoidea TaxID=1286919 RepID=A0ACC1L3V6_9FUNG|nr:hypothetical protein H4R21_003312 [Coemansia helicoidea]
MDDQVRLEIADFPTDYTCAFRITYQLLGHLNTGDDKGGWDMCKQDSVVGYVAGIARFTTSKGTVLDVVDDYKASPNYKDEFDALYEAIKTAAKDKSAAVDKLEGFCDAWTEAAGNGGQFATSQINVARKIYDVPTRTYVKKHAIKFPLTRAALVFVGMAHGLGDSGALLGGVIEATNAKFTADVEGESGNSVKVGTFKVDEAEWLSKFLDVSDELSNTAHKRMSDVFRGLVEDKQFKLSSTLKFKGLGDKQLTFKCKKTTTSPKP